MSVSATTKLLHERLVATAGVPRAAVCLALILAGLAVGLSGPSTALAAERRGEAEAEDERVYIDAIVIEGLERTKPFVIHRELLVKEEQIASVERVEESIQRVRNTGLFRKVRYELDASEADAGTVGARDDVAAVTLRIEIDEKWTTLPIFNFSRGGGTYRLIVGGFDDNFLGRYIGVGGQYERLGDANSFYGWLYHPRLFGQRLRGGIDVGTQNRVYPLYEESGELGGGFLLNRFTAGGYLQKEWRWWLRTQASVRWMSDDFSFDLLSPEVIELQRRRGLPEPSHSLLGSLNVMVGRIDQDNYLLDGQLLSVSFAHANEAVGSSHDLSRLTASYDLFETLPWKSNFGFRAAVGAAATEEIHHRFFFGGLDAIRGFRNDRFAGEHYWLTSLEYRIPSIDLRWLVVQHIAFIDAAGIAEDLSGVAQLSGASAGVGVRFIIPKIHGFIARVDYAFALHGQTPSPLSFGGGQFF